MLKNYVRNSIKNIKLKKEIKDYLISFIWGDYMKFIKELIPYLAIILIVMIIRTFIVTPIIVKGESMMPTLNGGEFMLLKKYDKSYDRFDIVVVNKNVEGDNLIIIKPISPEPRITTRRPGIRPSRLTKRWAVPAV